MKRTIFIAALLAAAPMGLTAAAAAPFDGEWDVGITVDSGACDSGYLLPIKVRDGAVSYNGRVNTTARGSVNDAGSVNVHFTHKEDEVSAVGQLSGASGVGKWTSATLKCAGRWQANRK